MTKTIIAMWSGPRNLSTAMMRAFESRKDTEVLDEPFYAHYLVKTGVNHPLRIETIASQENDWGKVSQRLVSEIPNGKIVEWAKREGRSNNAIRSRINKYDFHEKTSKPYNNSFHSFGGEEIKIIREAMKEVTNRNKRKLIMLSNYLGIIKNFF